MSCFPLETLEIKQGAATSLPSIRGLFALLLPQVKQIRPIHRGHELPSHQDSCTCSALPPPAPSSFLQLYLPGVP